MTDQENNYTNDPSPDPTYFKKFVNTKMPYGKYAGRRLVDLPEHYIVWMSNQGFPKGELGDMLREVYEIKANGLEYLFKKQNKTK